VEKLNEQSKHLELGKESAEKQIKAMSSQMMTSLENYRRGFDDVLERNKAQLEESKKKFEDEIKQLRKEVCGVELVHFVSDNDVIMQEEMRRGGIYKMQINMGCS